MIINKDPITGKEIFTKVDIMIPINKDFIEIISKKDNKTGKEIYFSSFSIVNEFFFINSFNDSEISFKLSNCKKNLFILFNSSKLR